METSAFVFPSTASSKPSSSQERQGAYSGCVNLYTEDGEHNKDATIQRSSLPTSMAWHPTNKWLATGWASGEVILWNEAAQMVHECKALHTNGVDVLEWSRDGSLLISGDSEGRIGVWKPAKNGKLVRLGAPMVVGKKNNVDATVEK